MIYLTIHKHLVNNVLCTQCTYMYRPTYTYTAYVTITLAYNKA